VGLLGKVAENMGDPDVNANGGGSGVSGGKKEVGDGDVEWPAAGKIGDLLGRLKLHVLFGADEVGKWGQELDDGKDCISDVVMEAGFEFFGEAAEEEAQGRLCGVKKREAELAANEEVVPISQDVVVLEASQSEGSKGGCWWWGRGEEVLCVVIKGGRLGEKMGGSVVVIEAVLETSGGDIKDQLG
jgi:hypothetical protein